MGMKLKRSFNFVFSRFSALFEKKKAELLKIAKSKEIELKKRPTNAELIIAILVSESFSVKSKNDEYYKMKREKMLTILKKNKKELLDDLQNKKNHKGLKLKDKKKKLVGLLVTYESKVVRKRKKKKNKKRKTVRTPEPKPTLSCALPDVIEDSNEPRCINK